MFKIILKTLLISCLLIAIGFYTNYLLTGNLPNVVSHKVNMPDLNLSKISESATDLFDFNEESASVTKYLYKWRDAKGVMHYTSEKPAADIKVETIELTSDTNIVPAISDEETQHNPALTQSRNDTETVESSTDLYTPEGIEQLYNQANDVQNLINEHYDQQKAVTK
jgi:Domain of unknown function (DUF4124)